MEIPKRIISDVLTALYQPFWFAVILSILFMFIYKSYPNMKEAARQWVVWFKTEVQFRKVFLLVFYTVMILFRTLLNRNLWLNPLSNVLGNWALYNENGDLTTECLENMALFIPFTVLLLWTYRKKVLGGDVKPGRTLWESTKIVFLFSFTIEFLQLFLCLGTWQLSDLFYNTVGGTIGGLIYWIGYRVKHRK